MTPKLQPTGASGSRATMAFLSLSRVADRFTLFVYSTDFASDSPAANRRILGIPETTESKQPMSHGLIQSAPLGRAEFLCLQRIGC